MRPLQPCAHPNPEWGPWQGRAPSACPSCLSFCPQTPCPTDRSVQAGGTAPGPWKGKWRTQGLWTQIPGPYFLPLQPGKTPQLCPALLEAGVTFT